MEDRSADALLWVLRKIDAMPSLAQQFDTTEAVKKLVFPPASVANFVVTATLRSEGEIQSEYEKIALARPRCPALREAAAVRRER